MPQPVALVTGGARRLGRVMAQALAADGYAVAIHHHRTDPSEAVAAVTAAGGQAAAFPADLADAAAVEALLPDVAAALGPPTVLINNAAVYERDAADTFTTAGLNRHLAVNLRAPLVLMREMAARLPADVCGQVVQILDAIAWRPRDKMFSYSLAKLALREATALAAWQLAPRLRVNGIALGAALAPEGGDEAGFRRLQETAPLPEPGGPRDLVAALRYLLTAAAVTGEVVSVDGGRRFPRATRNPTA